MKNLGTVPGPAEEAVWAGGGRPAGKGITLDCVIIESCTVTLGTLSHYRGEKMNTAEKVKQREKISFLASGKNNVFGNEVALNLV